MAGIGILFELISINAQSHNNYMMEAAGWGRWSACRAIALDRKRKIHNFFFPTLLSLQLPFLCFRCECDKTPKRKKICWMLRAHNDGATLKINGYSMYSLGCWFKEQKKREKKQEKKSWRLLFIMSSYDETFHNETIIGWENEWSINIVHDSSKGGI